MSQVKKFLHNIEEERERERTNDALSVLKPERDANKITQPKEIPAGWKDLHFDSHHNNLIER